MKNKVKTLRELNAMKNTFINTRNDTQFIEQNSLPIITSYEQFFNKLEYYFLYKTDGVKLVSLELDKWDQKSKAAILGALSERIMNKEFNEDELKNLKIS